MMLLDWILVLRYRGSVLCNRCTFFTDTVRPPNSLETLGLLNLIVWLGARYSTSTGSIASFAGRIHNATSNSTIKATGSLSFLNTWKYKLGSEILSPFGRYALLPFNFL